jgi:hypothetical protein
MRWINGMGGDDGEGNIAFTAASSDEARLRLELARADLAGHVEG